MAQEGVFKADDFIDRLQEQPFIPFRIHMSDGSHYDVPHPELAIVFPRHLAVMIPSARRPGLMQKLRRCGIIHITRLENLAEAG